MELVKVEMEVPKESKEALDFAADVAVLVAKKQWNQALNLIQEAIKAGEGADQIPAEFKSEHMPELVAYAALKLGKGLKS